MDQRQRENLAKYTYDLSKIIFAAVVIQNLVALERASMLALILGIAGMYVFAWVGYALDEVEK